MAKALEVHITAPDRARAETMARALVGERLAACVNIVGGVRSIYRWEGQIEEADEVLCFVKTRPELLPELAARVRALHPYAVPEILAFDVDEGAPDYLAWLTESTTP
ncbi:MAG: divalent-cation tolerance protein CutA [Bacteroidota bacterium]